MNEWTGEGNSAHIMMAEPILVSGHQSDVIYTANSDELYSGITTIEPNGVKVNSYNSNVNTLMNANGFYVQQNGNNILQADGNGINLHQGRVTINQWGVNVNHDDGSYSQMNGSGFFNYYNGTGNRYHHLMTMGEYECYSEETKRIWLPAEFRNKPFRVVTSIKRIKANYDLYFNKAPLLSFYAHADSVSHAEGWIDIYASVRGWNHNNNMGSDRGQVIGDEPADDYILKPIVAYWVIV